MRREKVCGIYVIENITTHKKYVGQARDIYIRQREHVRSLKKNNHENNYLQNAWNKYGETSFVFGIIEKCSIEELNEKEIFYIKECHSHKTENGYNISWGGAAFMEGRKHSDEAKRKISIANKGKIISDETKKKMSESNSGVNNYAFGTTLSEETKNKISNSLMGEKNHFYNKHHTNEAKKIMSEAKSGEKHWLFGRKKPNSSSKYFGVCFDKNRNKWITCIKVKDKNVNLGRCDDEINAAKVYDEYVIKNNLPNPLNFPENK